ncbi:MAG: TolB family protein [Microcoleaceae cyanobacterium]
MPRKWLGRIFLVILWVFLGVLGAGFSVSAAGKLPTLNSFVTDEHPALSGNGRFLGFVSNREGQRQLLLYDLQLRTFVDLPFLNRPDAIAQNPSLSYSARYIVYVASNSGRPEIYLYDRKTHYSQKVTQQYQGWVKHPNISPDGRYITFETGRRGQWDIEVIDRGPRIELDGIQANLRIKDAS